MSGVVHSTKFYRISQKNIVLAGIMKLKMYDVILKIIYIYKPKNKNIIFFP